MNALLPPEPGSLSGARKIRYLNIPFSTPDKLLAQGGNGEADFLKGFPIYHKGGRIGSIPHQAPIPLRDKAVVLVSACRFGIASADIPGHGRKVQTAINNDSDTLGVTHPAGHIAYADLIKSRCQGLQGC